MDGVLSSLSRFFMLSLHVCAFASIPHCIETHTHLLLHTHTKRNKERETKEHDEKIVHKRLMGESG
jgi:hypothetical protein